MNAIVRVIVVFSTLVAAYIYQQIYHYRPSGDTQTAFPSYNHGPNILPLYTPSLYAIADIHGDYPKAHSALQNAGIVDFQGNWIAGNATLVQTGDIVDRGPDTQLLYSFFRNLTQQASKSGGNVVKLWGNHEYMNAMHDWRYVHPQDLASFPPPYSTTRLAAFSRTGSIGADWLLDYAVTHQSHLYRAHFMHAGLSPATAPTDVNSLGRSFMETLLDGKRDHSTWSSQELHFWSEDGPMWYRGHALLPDDEVCVMADRVRRILDVDFLVMGHTPNFDGALTRCGGHILLIDTGLSSAYGGRPVVLEMRRSDGIRSPEGQVEVGLWYDDEPKIQLIDVE